MSLLWRRAGNSEIGLSNTEGVSPWSVAFLFFFTPPILFHNSVLPFFPNERTIQIRQNGFAKRRLKLFARALIFRLSRYHTRVFSYIIQRADISIVKTNLFLYYAFIVVAYCMRSYIIQIGM